jgi:L-alanine-DL-glutamate epimerase-like enolase superfamily enzyme
MIFMARALNMKIMLGCMIESSVAIAAGLQISPFVDWLDLDGNLLIANDPYKGLRINKGKWSLPEASGIGVVSRQA